MIKYCITACETELRLWKLLGFVAFTYPEPTLQIFVQVKQSQAQTLRPFQQWEAHMKFL